MTSQQRARLRACALARLAYCGKEERLSFFIEGMPKWTLQIARFGWNSSERPIAFAERSKSEPGRTGRARGALVEPSVPFDRFDLADELALRMHVWWASALPAALSGSLHEDIFFG